MHTSKSLHTQWGDDVVTDERAALVELCSRGLLTCTTGEPGADGATYAVAWLPLDNATNYPPEVRERHARNLARFHRKEIP